MFKILPETKGDLVAIEVSGKLEKADFDAFLPVFEDAIKANDKISIFWEMTDFHGWTLGGAKEDLTFDVKHNSDVKKLAMVGDKEWQEWMTTLMKPFTNAEMKYFEPRQRAEAMTWVR